MIEGRQEDTPYMNIVEQQKSFFLSGKTHQISFRLNRLDQLARIIEGMEGEILRALELDLGKSEFEGYVTEITLVLNEIRLFQKNLRKWVRTKSVGESIVSKMFFGYPSSNHIYHCPKGRFLLIAPWNYPFQLTMMPLIGIVAAGNCVIVKPSEVSTNTSDLVAKIIDHVFEESHVAAIPGGIDVATQLLDCNFDHIVFTGSTSVGKIVMKKAAEYLTPVTLELGGKSPCIVDRTADLKLAAKRIINLKFMNAGQTCIAPDYVLVDADIRENLLHFLRQAITKFYGSNPQKSMDYPRIINQSHFDRLVSLISVEKDNVVLGGQIDREDLYIAPTIINQASWNNKIMEDEIFGPILPVLDYTHMDTAIEQINQFSKPLSLSIFTRNQRLAQSVIQKCAFGGGCINDVATYFSNYRFPFGGVGESGIGRYHGRYSIEEFTHQKPIVARGSWLDMPIRYPPFDQKFLGLSKIKWVRILKRWF